METQLSFLEMEKKEKNKAKMVKIFAIYTNHEEQASITESLIKGIPNSTVKMARNDLEFKKQIRVEQPDVIILDWVEDNGSSADILEKIRYDGKLRHIPLIVFTKEPRDAETRSRVLKMGASAFLSGLINAEELVAQINAILNLKREKEILRREKDRLEALVSESNETLKERTYDLDKRVRELNCLYRISELREKKGISLEELLQGVADLIPSSWQYPENICARILLGYQVFTTDNFQETPWKLVRDIIVNGEWAGNLEVFYLRKPDLDEDFFPKEEASLISIIAERLGRIAERVQAEESLQFESENITRILKSMEDRVYIVNQDFDMEYINPALKKEFGRTGGKKCYTYFRNRTEPCRGCRIEDVYAGKTVRRERYYPSIRRTYDVVETPLRNKDGSLSKLAIYRDVTALKQAQKALEEREALYRGVTESIADGAVMVQDGKVMFVNHALVEMFGYGSPRELTGIEVFHLFDRDFRGLFRRFFDPQEKDEELENLVRGIGVTKSGKKFWVSTHRSVIELKSLPAILATMRDITEAKLQEESFIEVTEHLQRENIKLKSSIKERYRFCDIVGKSLPMQEVYELILQAAGSDASVIILGESGTGKELVARAIHDMSPLSDKAFVPVNCGAIPENLVESEFFGYRRGAFTGAHDNKTGYLHSADGGTLFLDEVGELGFNIQVKLLRALERGEYSPVGDTRLHKSKFRVISATNRDFSAMVPKGLIREDFFYRISVIPIQLPPLRERKEDIPLLIEHFLKMYVKGKKVPAIPAKITEILYNHDWPGNVRELQSVIQRYLAVGNFDFLSFNEKEEQKTPDVAGYSLPDVPDLRVAVERFEKDFILSVLNHNQWHRGKAATAMGIDPKTLYTKMKKIGLS